MILNHIIDQKQKSSIVVVSEDVEVLRGVTDLLTERGRSSPINLYFINEKPFKDSFILRNLFYAVYSGCILSPPMTELLGNYSSALPKMLEKVSNANDCITAIHMSKKVPLVLLKPSMVQYVISGAKDIWPMAPRENELDSKLKRRVSNDCDNAEYEQKYSCHDLEMDGLSGREILPNETNGLVEINSNGFREVDDSGIKVDTTMDQENYSETFNISDAIDSDTVIPSSVVENSSKRFRRS